MSWDEILRQRIAQMNQTANPMEVAQAQAGAAERAQQLTQSQTMGQAFKPWSVKEEKKQPQPGQQEPGRFDRLRSAMNTGGTVDNVTDEEAAMLGGFLA